MWQLFLFRIGHTFYLGLSTDGSAECKWRKFIHILSPAHTKLSKIWIDLKISVYKLIIVLSCRILICTVLCQICNQCLSDTSGSYWAQTWMISLTDEDANNYALSPPLTIILHAILLQKMKLPIYIWSIFYRVSRIVLKCQCVNVKL